MQCMVDTDIHARAAYDRPYEMLTSALAESVSYEQRTNGMMMAPPRHALVVESKKDEKLKGSGRLGAKASWEPGRRSWLLAVRVEN